MFKSLIKTNFKSEEMIIIVPSLLDYLSLDIEEHRFVQYKWKKIIDGTIIQIPELIPYGLQYMKIMKEDGSIIFKYTTAISKKSEKPEKYNKLSAFYNCICEVSTQSRIKIEYLYNRFFYGDDSTNKFITAISSFLINNNIRFNLVDDTRFILLDKPYNVTEINFGTGDMRLWALHICCWQIVGTQQGFVLVTHELSHKFIDMLNEALMISNIK